MQEKVNAQPAFATATARQAPNVQSANGRIRRGERLTSNEEFYKGTPRSEHLFNIFGSRGGDRHYNLARFII